MAADRRQPVMEKVAKESGNSAHVYVPSEWDGDVVRIQRIAPGTPPLFETVEDDDKVRVEYLGDGGEKHTVEGTVEKRQLDLDDDEEVTFTVFLDCDGDEWRLVATRGKNEAEWNEEYRVKRQKTKSYTSADDPDPTEITDDAPDSDDYVELMPTAEDEPVMTHISWDTVGVIKSFAVKQSVSLD